MTLALCLLAACGCFDASAGTWQPVAGHTQIPIWPGAVPDAKPMPGQENETRGKTAIAIRNVVQPTLTVYPPKGTNTGAAVVVFPGGGFEILAIDLEGTEVCDWLTATGITCVLL